MIVSGFTSTGSKRPTALFGPEPPVDLPTRMTRSQGARVWDADGREYLDLLMALGAVSLGYGHSAVTLAAVAAIDRGGVGPLPPIDEERLAARLAGLLPWLEGVRFLKTGAEAVAAAIRLARVATNRERVLGCGYHGWLDLTNPGAGVPVGVQRSYATIPFNDGEAAVRRIRERPDELAAVVVEPIVDGPPSVEWLRTLRDETSQVGAVLVFDEIKTGFRIALGGAIERWGVVPDLVVYGKALGNGFPIALVGGARRIMDQVGHTWISSTLATEFVALAAADATVEHLVRLGVPAHLGRIGGLLHDGLTSLAPRFPGLVTGVLGVPEMTGLRFMSEEIGIAVAIAAARRGLLFKRTAYNFVSLAHGEAEIATALGVVEEALVEVARRC